VIPADQKWYRNYAICRTLVHTLRAMELKFPNPIDDLENLKVE
jgi:hypothetical protein